MSHLFDHATLRRAAENLITITGAGYREQVRREYHERIAELPLDQQGDRCRDPVQDLQLRWDAELLARLTDTPLSDCVTAIREASGDFQRREVGLTLLRELAGEVRRLQAQAARGRLSGRASA